MKQLLTMANFLLREERKSLLRGLALSVAVLVAGIALLGLSGWFITAASIAGLAGVGIAFDIFRPSAGVRFLALGRTAARYGERMLSHDATLRALATLRVQVLKHLTNADFQTMIRLRGEEAVTRMTADVDALDGLAIRLLFPLLAGGATLLLAFIALSLLVDLSLALFIVLTFGITSWAILIWLGTRTYENSVAASRTLQLLRQRTIEHLRGRAVLAFANTLHRNCRRIIDLEKTARTAETKSAKQEILAGACLSTASSFVTSGALLVGGYMVINENLDPALAALGFFCTLAMFETIAPLRRGIAELGPMRDSADRLVNFARTLSTPKKTAHRSNHTVRRLDVNQLQIAQRDRILLSVPLTFHVLAGETVALTGSSGIGKSTVLNAIAGLQAPKSGSISIDGILISTLAQNQIRETIGYLPQRNALLSGTIRDATTLGTAASDPQILEVLETVALAETIAQKGGLTALLGEAGAGLSGGQAKRLALARILLKRPDILVLDEVTEGLDDHTANKVLTGIRHYLPDAVILMAAHRELDTEYADRSITLH